MTKLYFTHEIDRNPAASDVGTIKAHVTMVTYGEDMDDSVHTFSFTWLAEDIMEDKGFASKLQDVYELFMKLEFPQEESLLEMIRALSSDIIRLTSSADYSRDCALSVWFTFRAPLHNSPTFVHPIKKDEDNEMTNKKKIKNIKILNKAASKLELKSLPRKTYNKGDSLVSDNCTICLEEFKDGATLMILPCGHEFDDECITDWFTINHVCPLCRFELKREDVEN